MDGQVISFIVCGSLIGYTFIVNAKELTILIIDTSFSNVTSQISKLGIGKFMKTEKASPVRFTDLQREVAEQERVERRDLINQEREAAASSRLTFNRTRKISKSSEDISGSGGGIENVLMPFAKLSQVELNK